MSSSSNVLNIPSRNFVLEEETERKYRKKKHIITSLSNKIQKKIAKNLAKNLIDVNTTTTPKLIKSSEGSHSSHNNKVSSSSSSFSKFESPRDRRLREIQEKRKEEEEREKSLKQGKKPLLLPPVPPRGSSIKNLIPTRNSSNNYDANYLNNDLFEKIDLSKSASTSLSRNKEAKDIKHSLSDNDIKITSTSISTNNSDTNNININDITKIKSKSDTNLNDTNETNTNINSNTDTNLNENPKANKSFEIDIDAGVGKDDDFMKSILNESIFNNLIDLNLSVSDKDQKGEALSKDKLSEDKEINNNKIKENSNKNGKKSDDKIVDIDYSSDKTLNEDISEKKELIKENKENEKEFKKTSTKKNKKGNKKSDQKEDDDLESKNVNEIFKRESEKYMDKQLLDLCTNYYKDYFYFIEDDENDNENEREDSENEDNDEEDYVTEETNNQYDNYFDEESEETEEYTNNNGIEDYEYEVSDNKDDSNSNISTASSNSSNSDDSNQESESKKLNDFYPPPFDEHSYIVKSNTSTSYFGPNRQRNKKDITKRNTLPVMDAKRISPKIITCPSDDPSKPITHLVNISGVTIQTNDLTHLFWVPSYLHPELHPQEFKKWANSEDMLGRRTSVRRTKSFAESARVITPDSTSENGEPVVDPVRLYRNKTFDTFQSLNKVNRSSNLKRSRNIRLKKSTGHGSNKNDDEPSFYNPDEDILNKNRDQKNNTTIITNDISSKVPIHEDKEQETITTTTTTNNNNNKENQNIKINKATIKANLLTPPPAINTKPLHLSTLHNSTTIPTSPELTEPNTEDDNNNNNNNNKKKHNVNSLLDTDYSDMEEPPLVGMPDAIYACKEDEIPQTQKSGWSLWWSSFGKDDKKESETTTKKAKKSSNNKSYFSSFFKSGPKSSNADKHKICQGKGITEAYLLDEPLELKPLTRPTEDALYGLSHMKLATTYRSLKEQVHIYNLMRRYITMYADAAYKIPFKTARPMKKRRSQTMQQQQQVLANNQNKSTVTKPKPRKAKRNTTTTTPMIKVNNTNTKTTKTKKTTTTTVTTTTNKKIKTNANDNNKGIEKNNKKLLLEPSSEPEFRLKPKRRSKLNKGKENNNNTTTTKNKPIYKNINHSISTEQFEYGKSKSSRKLKNKYSNSSVSLAMNTYSSNKRNYNKSPNSTSPNRRYHYFSSSSSSSEDDDDEDDEDDLDEDDNVPLGVLKTRRTSIITI
ncbi:hypothetical protein BCR32DRAFT_282885 [Anaeromyces robustus]|uniref:Protein Zds1 C-terminal domain-containing protein n=1 Tax=Anaeromyces robustus TaxID=1754192 RepID=A0A1Y1WXA4_9FUNG|nr:hypothetical protein BCR32DRAFT_282885 [Anaeromyces robustus]|eukprot:ORX77754.1 hypothetical protein BCR32DRAFT_282885 [Anaeromyces robustus]